jgi:hypothetical protein
VDVEHAVAFVNAIYRAFFDAGFVHYVYTWQSDYISHSGFPSKTRSILTVTRRVLIPNRLLQAREYHNEENKSD